MEKHNNIPVLIEEYIEGEGIKQKDVETLKSKLPFFDDLVKKLFALGDETRFHLLKTLGKNGNKPMRVIELSQLAHLSRPATSRHMQILVDCGLVSSIKDGTFVYYYFQPDSDFMDEFLDVMTFLRDLDKNNKNKMTKEKALMLIKGEKHEDNC